MRIFIGNPPVVYKYIWVVAEADFKHIQKIAFGRSLKHCKAGELLWSLEFSFWIKCSYLLYLSSQITGSCCWQLGRVIQSILPVNCVWLAQWAMSDQNSGAAELFYKSTTQLQQRGCKAAGLLSLKSPKLTSVAILLSWPPVSPSMDHPQELAWTQMPSKHHSSSFSFSSSFP